MTGDSDDRGDGTRDADAESAGDPEVPVVCPECETTTRVALTNLEDALDRHNERLHDGESVAEVDPDLAEELADMVAQDLGLLSE